MNGREHNRTIVRCRDEEFQRLRGLVDRQPAEEQRERLVQNLIRRHDVTNGQSPVESRDPSWWQRSPLSRSASQPHVSINRPAIQFVVNSRSQRPVSHPADVAATELRAWRCHCRLVAATWSAGTQQHPPLPGLFMPEASGSTPSVASPLCSWPHFNLPPSAHKAIS